MTKEQWNGPWCEECDTGVDEEGRGHMYSCSRRATRAASAGQDPVAREQEQFEAWWLRDVPEECKGAMLARQKDINGYIQGLKICDAWDAWKERASRVAPVDREPTAPPSQRHLENTAEENVRLRKTLSFVRPAASLDFEAAAADLDQFARACEEVLNGTRTGYLKNLALEMREYHSRLTEDKIVTEKEFRSAQAIAKSEILLDQSYERSAGHSGQAAMSHVLMVAREAGFQVRIDGKLGNPNYTSVFGSYPALAKFAELIAAPQPTQSEAQSVRDAVIDECAMVCERIVLEEGPSAVGHGAYLCQKYIRALKSKQPNNPEQKEPQ